MIEARGGWVWKSKKVRGAFMPLFLFSQVRDVNSSWIWAHCGREVRVIEYSVQLTAF